MREQRLIGYNEIFAQSISDLKRIRLSSKIGIGSVRDLAKYPKLFSNISKLRKMEHRMR
jgi:hypothetical protein